MSKPRIAIFHSTIFEAPALAELRAAFAQLGEVRYFPFLLENPAHLKQHASDADIIVMNDIALTAADLLDLPQLKMISLLGSGYDMVDLAAMRAGGVSVHNAPTYGIENVAQHTVSLLLALTNHVGTLNQHVSTQGWEKSRPESIAQFPILELKGKTVGFVGYGNTSRRVQEMLSGFGVHFIASSSRTAEDLSSHGVEKVSLETLFASADIVTIHARATAANHHLVNTALLQTMQPSSLLINTARGELVNEADLAHALQQGYLAGAALDVLESEPPASDNPLLGIDTCILTPHIAWNSHAARARIVRESYENVRAFLAGAPINVVN